MRKKISKVWAKKSRIDQNLRKNWGKWNSCPPGTVRLVTALGPNTYHIMYGEILDFQCQHQQWWQKCKIGKSIFAVNLPLKLFRATVANADIRSLKSLHIFLRIYLYQNHMVQNTQNFKLFDKKKKKKKKTGFLKPFLTNCWCHFERRFYSWK